MSADFKAKAYVKEGCPFSFKFLVFMAEAGLLDEIEIVRLEAEGAVFEATKERLSAALGKPATFPTVEVAPGRFMLDSDRVIEHFAARANVEVDDLPVLAFYKQTILPKVVELHKLKTRTLNA